MRLLDLFSGTHSVGRAFQDQGWDVTSLANDSRTRPTICCDIMSWQYTDFAPDYFDHIHASPPCTEYSRAKTKGVRDLFSADCIAEKALEVIKYFSSATYSIENPCGGKYTLEKRGILDDLPRYVITLQI